MKNICCRMGLAACLLLPAGWSFSSKVSLQAFLQAPRLPKARVACGPWQRYFQDGHGAAPKAALTGSLGLGCLHPQPLAGGRCSVSEHFFISALGCFYTLPHGCSWQKTKEEKFQRVELLQGSCRKASGWRRRSSELAAVWRGGSSELTQY